MQLISQHTLISILVPDQDEALHFYTQQLGLEKRCDMSFGPGLRLLTVAPAGQRKPEIALARPDISWHAAEQVHTLMQHVGQRAPWIFVTDNCHQEYEQLLARGVCFVRTPSRQLYGLEAVFQDPFGNPFALLEASPEMHMLFKHYTFGTAA